MSLSCSCGDYDYSDWQYYPPSDYSILNSRRSKRCCSCKKLIKPGSVVIRFERVRQTNNYIEERIYGNDKDLASWYMCEECGDLFFSLDELGFCMSIGDESMKSTVEEYNNMVRNGDI